MIKSTFNASQPSLFFSLADTLNRNHPLYILANEVDWKQFEVAFEPLYCPDNGRPAKPIRLMVGLLILKHVRNLSDESVVEQWSENVYYQFFCGAGEFIAGAPCVASELVHFRHRIGESGMELIFKESIRINGPDAHDTHVSVDTTVQEKNITFPTDSKLHRKIIQECRGIATQESIALRQRYTSTEKRLRIAQRFRNHPKNKAKARKADRQMKTIAGRLVRELDRKLALESKNREKLGLFTQILKQEKKSTNKIYSIHEPHVKCISKGKEHKKYEFGNKVSIAYTQNSGVIVGALGLRNEYDGHTLASALEQVTRLTNSTPKVAVVDRGYRGNTKIGSTEVWIPGRGSKKQTASMRQKRRKAHQKRSAIEPIIGHLKTDHRLGRNFYKGLVGDQINVLLAAAAFNFKRMMRKWASLFWQIYQGLLHPVEQWLFFRFSANLGF